MKFLGVGDLHLGAGADLGRLPGDRLAEQEHHWLQIVKTANELEATILFAGDAWERRRPSPVELLAFREPLHWLKYPAVIIPGNHDVEAFDRPTGYEVFLIEGGRAQLVPGPAVVRAGGAQIACLPWAPPGHLVALQGGGDRDELNRRFAVGLLEIARGMFARMSPDEPRILLGHWHVDSATTVTGRGASEIFREPLLDYAALEAIGFDAIVLGHNHLPQMLGDRGLHVGSPMPLNFGEAATEHCVWLLDVEPGEFSAFKLPIPSRPLAAVTIEASELLADDFDLNAAGWGIEGATVKAKIRATPDEARRVDVAAVKRWLEAAGAHKVWAVQVEETRADAVRGVAVDENVDDTRAMELWLDASYPGDDELADELFQMHCRYLAEAAA